MRRGLLVLAGVVLWACVPVPHPQPPAPPPVPVPVPAPTMRLTFWITDDRTHAPIPEASVWVGPAGEHSGTTNADGFVAVTDVALASRVLVHLEAAGYVRQDVEVDVPADRDLHMRLAPSGPPPFVWSPDIQRDPTPGLPPIVPTQPSGFFAGVWSQGPYETDIPFQVPTRPDRVWHRGNFLVWVDPACDLPLKPWGTDKDRHVILSWDLPTYTVEQQACILNDYQRRKGYTHFLLSVPQARNKGVLDKVAASAALAKQYGQYVIMVALGGDGEDWDRDVRPVMQALVSSDTLDEIVTCWQCDFRYPPWELVQLTEQIGAWAHARNVLHGQHWVNEALAWWNAADDPRRPNTCLDHVPAICNRFDYHRVLGDLIDFPYLQVDTEAPLNHPTNGGIQGSIGDVLRSLSGRERLVVAEYDTQAEFDNPAQRVEAAGDLKGYLLTAARWNGRYVLGGFMGGGMRPDGRVH